jgi:hypothetical protein
MPLGDNSDPNINYFVWNNTADPRNNPSWNYFFDAGDALFSASSAPAPCLSRVPWRCLALASRG